MGWRDRWVSNWARRTFYHMHISWFGQAIRMMQIVWCDSRTGRCWWKVCSRMVWVPCALMCITIGPKIPLIWSLQRMQVLISGPHVQNDLTNPLSRSIFFRRGSCMVEDNTSIDTRGRIKLQVEARHTGVSAAHSWLKTVETQPNLIHFTGASLMYWCELAAFMLPLICVIDRANLNGDLCWQFSCWFRFCRVSTAKFCATARVGGKCRPRADLSGRAAGRAPSRNQPAMCSTLTHQHRLILCSALCYSAEAESSGRI